MTSISLSTTSSIHDLLPYFLRNQGTDVNLDKYFSGGTTASEAAAEGAYNEKISPKELTYLVLSRTSWYVLLHRAKFIIRYFQIKRLFFKLPTALNNCSQIKRSFAFQTTMADAFAY